MRLLQSRRHLSRAGWVLLGGTAGTEQRALPADGNSPRASPAGASPCAGGAGHPSRRRLPGALPGTRPPAALGPLKREWGGRRQPTSWERLLNMQMDIQEVRSSTSVQPFPAVPHTHSPWSQAGKGCQVPRCWLPRGAEAQKSNFPLEFGWKRRSGLMMVNCC